MSYLDAVDLVEATSDSAFELVVLDRAVELIEILLVEETLRRRPLDRLRAMLIESLRSQVAIGSQSLEEVHFWADSDDLCDRAPLHLVPHLPHQRLIHRAAGLTVCDRGLEVGHVEMFFIPDHVLVDIQRLIVIHQRVGICQKVVRLDQYTAPKWPVNLSLECVAVD